MVYILCFIFCPTNSIRLKSQELMSVEILKVISILGLHLFLSEFLPPVVFLTGSLSVLAAVILVSFLPLGFGNEQPQYSLPPHYSHGPARIAASFSSLLDVAIKESTCSLLDTGMLLAGSVTYLGIQYKKISI